LETKEKKNKQQQQNQTQIKAKQNIGVWSSKCSFRFTCLHL